MMEAIDLRSVHEQARARAATHTALVCGGLAHVAIALAMVDWAVALAAFGAAILAVLYGAFRMRVVRPLIMKPDGIEIDGALVPWTDAAPPQSGWISVRGRFWPLRIMCDESTVEQMWCEGWEDDEIETRASPYR